VLVSVGGNRGDTRISLSFFRFVDELAKVLGFFLLLHFTVVYRYTKCIRNVFVVAVNNDI